MTQDTTTKQTTDDRSPKEGDGAAPVASVVGGTSPSPTAAAQTRYKLVIDDNVVEKISALAVQKIDGIIDMKGGWLSTIQEGLGGNDQTKGVDADVVDDKNARIDLNIILKYGKSAPEVFEQVKQIIGTDLKTMTGLEVFEMTVNVVDVMTQEEYDQKRKSASPDPEDGPAA